jgi:hypothetical protein
MAIRIQTDHAASLSQNQHDRPQSQAASLRSKKYGRPAAAVGGRVGNPQITQIFADYEKSFRTDNLRKSAQSADAFPSRAARLAPPVPE